jgi:cobalamin biosynthetic protein CobC
LRSIGKFFGLAGVHLGFLTGKGGVERLGEAEQTRSVNHIALWLGERILNDVLWQRQQRRCIQHQQQLMQTLLMNLPSDELTSAGLFNTLFANESTLYGLFIAAAQAGILLCYGVIKQGKAWLRFGLQTDEQLPRLKKFFK